MKSLQESILSDPQSISKEVDKGVMDKWISELFVKTANKTMNVILAWDLQENYNDQPQWSLIYDESEKWISIHGYRSHNTYFLTSDIYYRMKELYEFDPRNIRFIIQEQGSNRLRIFVEERDGWKVNKKVVFTFSILKKNNELVLFNTEKIK